MPLHALVTGAAGFVGTAITARLLADGYRVVAMDNRIAGTDWNEVHKHPNCVRVAMDCRSYFKYTLEPAPAYDLIFHCAGIIGGRVKIENDPLALGIDLAIDAEFFNWVAHIQNKPRRVVYFSSSAVYPAELQVRSCICNLTEQLVNFGEARIGKPDMTYGWSKLTGEYLAQFAVQQYGVPVVIYRPFSGYGPGQSFDYPFPSIVKRVLDGENPVLVWGSGEQQRDFIHIDDVVEAIFATMDELAPGEVLNLGSGVGVSFRELALRTAKILGREITVINDPDRPEGVFRRVCDPFQLNRFFKPRIGLDEGIKTVIAAIDKRVLAA